MNVHACTYTTHMVCQDLVNPHVPHDDAVDGGGDFGPGVIALALVHHQMTGAQRVDHEVLPTELGGHGVLLPERPVSVLHMHRKHGRVVAHLGQQETQHVESQEFLITP